MANIGNEIDAILAANIGEEVRGKIAAALEKMNVQAAAAQEWATGEDDHTKTPSATNNAKYFAEQAAASAATLVLDPTLTQATQAAQAKAVGDALAGKVDAVPGKGLSENDFTDADKAALDNIKMTDTELDTAGKAADAKTVGDALAAKLSAADIDTTLAVSGKAADAKATGDAIAQIWDEIKGDNETILPSDLSPYAGYWRRDSAGKLALSTSEYYNTLENPTDISSVLAGMSVSMLVSISSAYGVFIADADGNILDYVDGSNAAEKGYDITSQPQLVTMIVPQNAKYMVSDIRSAYYTGMSDFDITAETNKIDQMEKSLAEKVDKITGKGLSTNDFTNADKTAIAAIQAELNLTEKIQIPYEIYGTGFIASDGTISTGSTNYKVTKPIQFGAFSRIYYKQLGVTSGSSSVYAAAVYEADGTFSRSIPVLKNQSAVKYAEALSYIDKMAESDEAYIRFTLLATETASTGYFSAYWSNYQLLNTINGIEADIEDVKETKLESIVVLGKNLFDPTKGESGYLKSDGGIQSSNDYITSDFVPVTSGQVVYINRIRKFLAYDTTKEIISGTYVDGQYDNFRYTATANGYIRASLYASYASSNIISYGYEKPDYEPYQETVCIENDVHLSQTLRSDTDKISGNVLAGKKWVACGDSFTEGAFTHSQTNDYIFTDTPYYGKNKVYPYFIGRRNQSMTVINEAVSGSTMTGGSSGVNAFSDSRYLAIPSDADYITLMFGINDAGNNIPIGTIDDNDNTTFYGAWNVVLGYFQEHFPWTKIGIIVGPGMQGSTGNQYANAEIAVAKKWGIPFLNIQFESGGERIPLMLRTSNPNVSTAAKEACDARQFVNDTAGSLNHHPNEKAHEFESTFIEAWLRTL